MNPSPALIITLPPATSAGQRDLLVGLLAGHAVLAIHEDAITDSHRWTVHFPDTATRDAAMDELTRGEGSLAVEAADIPDEDWARRTQADLPAIRIGRVTVAPPWDIPASDILVIIEPSRGFGTGHHQSTRLCVQLLQTRRLLGLTMTDVGTGSGVLAITAAKLGAAQVEAIDNDPDAVDNARENIALNGVTSIVRAHVRDLTEPHPPAADIVTANLTGTLLARYAGTLRSFVKPGGLLIVSGFNVEEREMVREAFEPDLMIGESAEEDDWWAFVLTRTRSGTGAG